LAHGEGGQLTHRLIQEVFAKAFGRGLETGYDAALLPGWEQIIVSTDSFVVHPWRFPGGDIGKLAVVGTVNDVAMRGGRAAYITAGFILEEGLPLSDLASVVNSMAQTARGAGVVLVAGDTKVVEKGKGDGIFINTTGFGPLLPGAALSLEAMEPGDVVIVSGTVGDHGGAMLVARSGGELLSPVESDCASLHGLAADLLAACGPAVKMLRDPTRGGLATSLVELAEDAGLDIEVEEAAVPVQEAVRGICELFGLDHLYLANEGKLVAIVREQAVDTALQVLRRHPLGKEAVSIGRVTGRGGSLYLKTLLGITKRLERLPGLQLPRIC